MGNHFKFIKHTGTWLCCFLCWAVVGKTQTTFTAMHRDHDQEVANLAGQLTNSALWLFIGAITLLGIAFIVCAAKACLQTGQRQNFTGKSFLLIFVLGLGLCFSLAGCTLAQQARIEDFHAAHAAENRICPMNEHIDHRAYLVNQPYSPSGHFNRYGPVFCGRCRQRIDRNR